MTTLARDASKYTVSPPPIDDWKASGVELLIIQAHPAGYGQERSLPLMRAAAAAGLPFDFYIYQYLTYTDWLPGALETMDLAAAEGLLPRKGWLDVEDNGVAATGLTIPQRLDAVQRDLDLMDAWLAAHNRPPAGIYSADWYWRPWLGNTARFTARQLWAAQYDNDPDTTRFTSFGGWAECRIKQYAGTQPDGTDLDSLSAAEAASLDGGDVGDCAELQQKVDGFATTIADIADRVGDLILAECSRPGGAAPRKAVIRSYVAQMHDERVQAVGPRPG